MIVSVHALHGEGFSPITGSVGLDVLEKVLQDTRVRMITFDDGLKSQALALPLLKKYGRKGIFFVNNENIMETHRAVREAVPDFYYKFQGHIEQYLPECYPAGFLSEYPFYSPKEKGYRYYRDFIDPVKHDRIITHLSHAVKINPPEFLDPALIVSSGNEIALHTATHPRNLPALKPHEQMDEWLLNLNLILKYQNFCNYASYPFGRYDYVSITLLKGLGIMDAFTSSQFSTGEFQTPRTDITQWK